MNKAKAVSMPISQPQEKPKTLQRKTDVKKLASNTGNTKKWNSGTHLA
jgi:hypothetical protein